jgi:hypothetical protein
MHCCSNSLWLVQVSCDLAVTMYMLWPGGWVAAGEAQCNLNCLPATTQAPGHNHGSTSRQASHAIHKTGQVLQTETELLTLNIKTGTNPNGCLDAAATTGLTKRGTQNTPRPLGARNALNDDSTLYSTSHNMHALLQHQLERSV